MAPPLTCTIIATNYVPQARVLARSLAEQHPGERLQVLVVDDVSGKFSDAEEPFDMLRPEDLALDRRAFHEMAACYEVVELATALKPSLLLTLLHTYAPRPILYLDPDIFVFSSLEALGAIGSQHPVVLTPHASKPMARDGRKPSELDILASGVWNLGCIMVSPGAEPFLEWWATRLKRDALVDHAEMLFTDQRWIDLALGCFDIHPLRDPIYNVAYWNADRRILEWTGERFLVDGAPLAFFHFSGFSPSRPHVLSVHQGDRPRILLSEQPVLRRLFRHYAQALEAEGLLDWKAYPYGFGELADGTPLTQPMRAAVRRALVMRDAGEAVEPPPDPFNAETLASFVLWLASPEPANEAAPTIPRVFFEIYRRRPDLKQAFPNIASVDADRFINWALEFACREEPIPEGIMQAFEAHHAPAPELSWTAPKPLRPGFLLTGYLDFVLGLGEAARRTLDVMHTAGLPCGAYAFGLSRSPRQRVADARAAVRTDFNTNLVWVNPDQLSYFTSGLEDAFFEDRYTVGYWAWETESPPAASIQMSELFDEIWTPSAFTRDVIQSVTETPVLVCPHTVVRLPLAESRAPRELGIPDGFVFLFMFDFFSTVSRKNPLGLIEAFTRAFAPNEGPTLVLKSVNGWKVPLEAEQVRCAIVDRDDIVLIDECFTAAECAAVLKRANAYVSLHRAEGFGLTIADAMAVGTPVIATGYSGNLEYMTDDNSYLVPATPAAVGPEANPYPAGDMWGEPDLDVAAALMRRVYESPAEARRKAARARREILTAYSYAASARFLASQFSRIQDVMHARPAALAHH